MKFGFLFQNRYCCGNWLAALGGICEPWILLYSWHSNSRDLGILGRLESKRPFDWNVIWFNMPDDFAVYHNKLYRLEKGGLFSTFKNTI